MSNSSDTVADLAKLEAHVQKLTRLGYVGGLVAVAVILAYVFWFWSPPSRDPQYWGQFGDDVGGLLNPTFSFLALLALLATLGLQMRELRESVRELSNSAEALAKQNETLRQQTFEGTFFQTLRLHNDIVNAISFPVHRVSGRACFDWLARELRGTLINEHATTDPEKAAATYLLFYRDHQAVLGHYFRLLYNLVKFVDAAPNIDKRFYTNLLRAQLSSSELLLIFYNCLSSMGRDKFKPLVEKYALLKTFPTTDELPDEALLVAYADSAFGGAYPKRAL